MKTLLSCCLMLLSLVVFVSATSTHRNTPHDSTTHGGTTTHASVTTTNSSSECSQYSGSCDACAKQPQCTFCNEDQACRKVLSKTLFDIGNVCTGGLWKASWLTCTVNMMGLIIGMGVTGGVLIIAVVCCICCCCCNSSAKRKLKYMKEDMKAMRSADDRKAKYSERRAERQAKNDEIRKKYGLYKGGESSYQKFDNEDA